MKLGKKDDKKIKSINYLSAKESRAISRRNRRTTDELEKKKNRKNVPVEEWVRAMESVNSRPGSDQYMIELQNILQLL